MLELPIMQLKKNHEKRLRKGHSWIYSNEVDTKNTPLNQFENGDQVLVHNSQGKVLGVAMMNPNNLICARLFSEDANVRLNEAFFVKRLQNALAVRERVFSEPYYRLVFADSDGLSGLIVDRFGDVLVAQINTAGLEKQEAALITAMVEVFAPTGILLRNDSGSRKVEGLTQEVRVAYGEVNEEVLLKENGVSFLAPVHSGQKTGWFFDHRMNRARLNEYVEGKSVLDVFSYIGGWGVQAAAAGAESVTCVDASEKALTYVQKNAELNQVQDKMTTLKGDAFEAMKQLRNQGESFDIVVIDPPAFMKRRKDIKNGTIAYQRLNELAMRLLKPQGILVSASCSMHLEYGALIELIGSAARKQRKQVRVLEQGHQGMDHPVHPAIKETDYLKSVIVAVD